MDSRFKWGLGTALLGLLGLALLASTGAFQALLGPDIQNRPVNLAAVGGSLLLVASGVATLVQARQTD
ncbi:hypothetical protein [Haloarcula salina]|uniref:Uncharacterized protein n=1 Tax=Haloarcula salina TaxID=1429914 RepID=A0AA41KJ85_9EURY|nr:hypothetical protein [Haloarcula salina]MBV0903611.1 hypothetical protein [Haloarcula salina]